MYMRERPHSSPHPSPIQPDDLTGGGGCPFHGHTSVVAAANDPQTYSSAVSRFLQLPNGLDGVEHATWRELIERFLTSERVTQLTPTIHTIACALVADHVHGERSVELVHELGAVFAVRAQLAWLGWDDALEPVLLAWMDEQYDAVSSGDGPRIAQAAAAFDAIVRGEVAARHERPHCYPGGDVTAELASSRTAEGELLTDAQIVSILRNWTAGDLGSLAASFGVIMHAVTTEPQIDAALRDACARADTFELDLAIDELLRRDDPFLSNRRVTTRPVDDLPAGARVTLSWVDANRDPAVFPDPDAYRPHAHAPDNLVWGTGPHVCPGRELATMELRELLTAVLDATTHVSLAPDQPPLRAVGGSLGGYRTVHAHLHPR